MDGKSIFLYIKLMLPSPFFNVKVQQNPECQVRMANKTHLLPLQGATLFINFHSSPNLGELKQFLTKKTGAVYEDCTNPPIWLVNENETTLFKFR